MTGSLATINIKFQADLKEFSTQMQNTQRRLSRIGKDLSKVGKNLTGKLTAPLAVLGGLAVKTFADFEQSMAKVQAVSGATATEFQALEKNALDLGSATRFTASEVAGLQLSFSKLGFNPQQILNATEATLNLALATGEDLANSATVAASVLNAFGLSATDTGRVTDVMAKSFSSSALDLEKFSVAMAILGPVAKTAGVGLEQATGYLSVLVDAGLDASTAGTGLRNIFLDLAKSGQSLPDALNKIVSSSNQNATAMDLFGKRGATVASVLAENFTKANQLAGAYQNSAGAAKAMADTMDATLTGSLAKMSSALEGLAIRLGQKIAPLIEQLSVYVAELADWFSNLSDTVQNIILVVSGLAAALGPVLVTLGFLMTSVIPGLITALGYLRAGFIALQALIAANPWVLLATAIATVATSIYLNRQEVEKLTKKITDLDTVRKNALDAVRDEKAEISALLSVAKSEKLSKEERLKAINKLRDVAPDYLKGITLENVNTEKTTKAVYNYIKALDQKALAQATLAKKQELYLKILEIQERAEKRSENSPRLKGIKNDIIDAQRAVDDFQVEFDKLTNQINNGDNSGLKRRFEVGGYLEDAKRKLEELRDEYVSATDAMSTVDRVSISLLQERIDKLTELQSKLVVPAQQDVEVPSVVPGTGLVQVNNTSTDGGASSPENHDEYLNTSLGGLQDHMDEIMSSSQEFQKNFNSIWQSTASDFLGNFGTILGGLANGSTSFKDIGSLFLTTIGDMSIRLGKMAIGIGLAVSGIKKALLSLNPAVAIAGGVALVALGTAVKGAVSNVASTASTGYTVPTTASGVSTNTFSPSSSLTNSVQAAATEIPYLLESQLQGADIKLSLVRQDKIDNRNS